MRAWVNEEEKQEDEKGCRYCGWQSGNKRMFACYVQDDFYNEVVVGFGW